MNSKDIKQLHRSFTTKIKCMKKPTLMHSIIVYCTISLCRISVHTHRLEHRGDRLPLLQVAGFIVRDKIKKIVTQLIYQD
mgnify:CR=1 FL=1